MNVTEKGEIELVVKYLRETADKEEDRRLRSAIVNVSCVLKQALENHNEDDLHSHLCLEIVKAKNLLDKAIDDCCTTDCIHVRNGTCPSPRTEEKYKCPTIERYLDS